MTAPIDTDVIRARATKARAWNARLRRSNADVDVLASDVAALCDEVERLRVATNALVFVGERMAILLSTQESDAGDAAVRDWRVEVEALAALKGTR